MVGKLWKGDAASFCAIKRKSGRRASASAKGQTTASRTAATPATAVGIALLCEGREAANEEDAGQSKGFRGEGSCDFGDIVYGFDRHMRRRDVFDCHPRVAARRLTLKKGSLSVNFPTVHTERCLSGRRIEGGEQRGWSG